MTETPREALDELLTTEAFFQDPFPTYARFQAETPVHWSASNGGWMIFRYDDIVETLRAPEYFSSRGRLTAAMERLDPGTRASLQPLEQHFSVGLISSDPPDHGRLRGLVNRAFTPKIVENLRPRVEAIVDELLTVAMRNDSFDVIRDFAFPLPATVIAELIGVPVESMDDFKTWTLGIMAFQGTGRVDPPVLQHSQTNLIAMRRFLSELAADRRVNPRDDLMSRLVAAEADGDKLTEAELLTTCVTLMTAGHETTTNLIGNGLHLLMTHPDQLATLREAPDMLPVAVEEMLRFQSPLQRNPRRIATDLEISGHQLKSGDYVMQMLGAANRDPDVFTNPQRFDITRQPNRHLAFGFGIHFCLGAPLARLEAPIAIGEVLRRLPNLRPAQHHVSWRRHTLLRGIESLPVVW